MAALGLAGAVCLGAALDGALAFELDPPGWNTPAANFNMVIPGQSAVINSAFAEAADLWTNNTVFSFNKISASSDPCNDPNDNPPANGVAFSAVSCDEDFGVNTLAVTTTWSGSRRVQSAITFNTAVTWSVYNGPWIGGRADFRRVAVHELGHVIGLDHTNNPPSVMEATIFPGSINEAPQADDIAGVAALYGLGDPPQNDDFAAATVLTGLPAMGSGQNFSATTETGEPLHDGRSNATRSIWWVWTAPATRNVTVSTFGTRFDTVLAIYEGAGIAALTPLASNDDVSTDVAALAGEISSRATFTAIAGRSYSFAVAGLDGSMGNADISVLPAASAILPANNAFSAATLVSGLPLSVTGQNTGGATKEVGEPVLSTGDPGSGHEGGASVWWRWTSPFSGLVTASTEGSQFDTMVGVYLGDSVDMLEKAFSNDDVEAGIIRFSRGNFLAQTGHTYNIVVDGWNAQTGAILLSLTATNASVANDDLAAAIDLSLLSQTSDLMLYGSQGSNVGASKEASEPAHAGAAGGASVWWNWTPALSGLGLAYTSPTTFDTVIGVYTGSQVDSLTQVGANDNDTVFSGTDSLALFPVIAGTTYRIAVDGVGGGSGDISLTAQVQLMPNDVVMNLGQPMGVWAYLNDATWEKINQADPSALVLADIDDDGYDEIIASFGPGFGLWLREQDGVWSRFNRNPATRLAVGDLDGNRKADVIADFGADIGTWVKMNGETWEQVNVNTTLGITIADLDDSGQDDVILNLPGLGVWARLNNGDWSRLNRNTANHMVAANMDGDPREELVIDLGEFGIWMMPNNGEWLKIHDSASEGLAVSDVDADAQRELFVDFGATGDVTGLWMREAGGVWTKIHDNSPTSMVSADLDANGFDELVADFGPGFGVLVYRNNKTWEELNLNAASVIAAGNIDRR